MKMLGHCDLRLLLDGRSALVLSEFWFVDPYGVRWVAPTGAVVNGASFPRFLWWIGSPFTGKYRRAAVLHDIAYDHQQSTRAEADLMKLQAMDHDGVAAWKRAAIYAAVRAFGWIAWNRARKKQFANA